MRKYNKTCIVCGEKYTFCSGCSEFDKFPRWMGIYHDSNCKDIFHIASEYTEGKINKDEAKELFDTCDLSNKNNFQKNILKVINDVYDAYKEKIEKNENVESSTTTKPVKVHTKKAKKFDNE